MIDMIEHYTRIISSLQILLLEYKNANADPVQIKKIEEDIRFCYQKIEELKAATKHQGSDDIDMN